MANFLTILRMVGTVGLLFLVPASAAFYWVYCISGVTDVLDGLVARLTKTTSDLGAKLDSAADLLFYSVMLIRLFPQLWDLIPRWIWIWVVAILVVRLASYLLAYRNTHGFSALHTILNKVTGFCVFLIPFFLKTPYLTPYCILVALVGTSSSAQELLYHIKAAAETDKTPR